jgi:hypothetical protein
MKEHFYYDISKKTVIQFLDMLNDIRIARFDPDTGEILKYIKIPLKFSPKSKNFYWIEKTDAEGRRIRDKILPIIGCNLVNLEFDPARLGNKHHRIRTGKIKDYDVIKYNNLVPYNFSFEVKIAAEYMIDILGITEQILPYFDPLAYIRITIPDLDIEHYKRGTYPLDLKVILESSSKEDTIEIPEADYRALLWNLSFKVEGYLSKKSITTPVIKTIFQDIYNSNTITPSGFASKLTTVGLSAEKFPVNVSTPELSGALYDENAKLLYKYEKEGD